MIFLRAFGLTRFAESQRTRRPGASCARRRRSTRFPQAKVKVSGIRDNYHCPAWRLLIAYARTSSSARRAFPAARRERNQSRGSARNAFCMDAGNPSVNTLVSRVHGVFNAARTVCLLARRRLGNQARTSCLSGREKLRRSTTTTVQGISPACDDSRILGAR